MRGKVLDNFVCADRNGITPAYAGKSKSFMGGYTHAKDHPCICGEKSPSATVCGLTMGSPLHMRGKDCQRTALVRLDRITPAYAGKRRQRTFVTLRYQDHPCICGEKSNRGRIPRRSSGSPLHMRGKDGNMVQQCRRYGITPAYAGKRHAPQAAL